MNQPDLTLKQFAQNYRSMGWNVIPLFNYSKNPSQTEIFKNGQWVREWKDLESRMATDEEYSHWFEEQTPTGIGVITGSISGIVVVDEDAYKVGGKRFEKDSPLKSRTARGGTHFFYKYDPAIKGIGFKKGVYIEVKSDGGFIVLPPSKVYINENKVIGTYRWEVARGYARHSLPTLEKADLATITDGEEVKYDVHDLVEAPLGAQHHSLRTLALMMFNRFRQSEWDVAEVNIREFAKKFNPPHPEYRVNKMIQDCKKFVLENPQHPPEQPQKKARPPRDAQALSVFRNEDWELEKIAPKTGYVDLDQIITGFVPGHLYTLTGNENVGKTTVAANFAVRVAKQGKKVLYIALEPGNKILDYLASARTGKRFDELNKEDISYNYDGNISFYVADEIESLADLVSAIQTEVAKADLIIIDHIGYFITDVRNPTQEQSNTIKRLARLARTSQTAIMMIAHLRKKGQHQKKDYIPTSDDISGSGAFKQDSTDVMIVVRTFDPADPNQLTYAERGKLFVTKTKSGPNGAVELFFIPYRGVIYGREDLHKLSYEDQLKVQGFPDRDELPI